MVGTSGHAQTIARLTSFAEVLAAMDSINPVAPRAAEARAACGRTLAADVTVAAARPQCALALHDGWAVLAETTLDAGSYAPAMLAKPPLRIDVGEALPEGADAVAALDTVVVRSGRAQVLAPVAPGEGVLPAGADCAPANPLRRAGERIRRADIAVFAAAGISRLSVREPRLRIVCAREKRDETLDAIFAFVAADIDARGAVIAADAIPDGQIEAAMRQENADAIIVIGGTGSGRHDSSVQTLARAGRVGFHGIGLTPGETAAFGFAGTRPVLLLPGRLDAALAVWLTVGRRMLARLAGCAEQEPVAMATLARKLASTVGLAEFVPVRRNGESVEPLATKYLPLSALARANGWILVPAESEGYPAGAQVPVRAWP